MESSMLEYCVRLLMQVPGGKVAFKGKSGLKASGYRSGSPVPGFLFQSKLHPNPVFST